ncbi:MAG: DUF2800 domain-containing protein [Peptococcales bacterium]|jgi:hypothetical protein
MGKHALLSASSSHRWLQCPPSPRLNERYEDKESSYAAEGTEAHNLAQYKLEKALGFKARDPTSNLTYYNEEMEECTTDYAAYIIELLEKEKQDSEDPIILIEQRLDFSNYVEDGFGTGDAVIVSDGALHIIDYKHGSGILIDSYENSQMMLYGLGGLNLFDGIYDIDTVAMTVYQPRRENISTYKVAKESLLKWAEEILKPIAKLAYAGDGDYSAGEWCRFCRAKHECRARADYNLELARYDFELPPILADEELEDILGKLDSLTSWASDIKDYALQAALGGKSWGGWKLVEGRSNRRYTDEEAVIKKVQSAGYDPYAHKIKGITAMEKTLGKVKFSELLDGLVEKPAGKPTLVPDSDKRPAINTAINDFNEN